MSGEQDIGVKYPSQGKCVHTHMLVRAKDDTICPSNVILLASVVGERLTGASSESGFKERKSRPVHDLSTFLFLRQSLFDTLRRRMGQPPPSFLLLRQSLFDIPGLRRRMGPPFVDAFDNLHCFFVCHWSNKKKYAYSRSDNI